jgi:hypothetical protein
MIQHLKKAGRMVKALGFGGSKLEFTSGGAEPRGVVSSFCPRVIVRGRKSAKSLARTALVIASLLRQNLRPLVSALTARIRSFHIMTPLLD